MLVEVEGERGMTLTSQEPIIVACAIQRARVRTHDAVLQSSPASESKAIGFVEGAIRITRVK